MEIFMLILDIAAALAVSVLCGLGVGGGGLFVLWLVLVRGVGQLDAQGLNLAFFICSSAASLCLHFKKRRLSLARIALLGGAGAVGSAGGALLAHAVPAGVVRTCFGVLLVGGGLLVLRPQKKGNKHGVSPYNNNR